jgi:altronate hydrolase
VDRALVMLIAEGAACVFDRTAACEYEIKSCEARPELADAIIHCLAKATRYSRTVGRGGFAVGNAGGGLMMQEKKSLDACANSDALPDVGIVKPGDILLTGGLYLLECGAGRRATFGLPKISDNAEIRELIACGCHGILFTTGRAPVVGSAISPVITVCAHPTMFRNLCGDMDVDVVHVLEGCSTLDQIGRGLFSLTVAVANGTRSKSEMLEHREFITSCNSFEPIGPACLPASAHDEMLHKKSLGLMAA